MVEGIVTGLTSLAVIILVFLGIAATIGAIFNMDPYDDIHDDNRD